VGEGLRVGFTYNVKRVQAADDGTSDEHAEYDSPQALEAIREAIRGLGHEVVDFEVDAGLPARLAAAPVDVVFNIAEGSGPRSREAHVPAVLELLGIACTGSDPLTLGLTLDKPLAKTVVAARGVRVPRGTVMTGGREEIPDGLAFPLIVKPAHEGSSKGIGDDAVVMDEAALRALVRRALERYGQPVLVEEYVAGRELTVAVLGSPPRVLPLLEVVFLGDPPTPVYSFRMKLRFVPEVRYEAPARLTEADRAAVEAAALECFAALGCRDVARLDFRLGADGEVTFLECNALPGLAPGWSDLCLAAEAAGIAYPDLIAEILGGALARRAAQSP